VLVNAVKDGVGRLDAPFAYATGKSEQGHHTGTCCSPRILTCAPGAGDRWPSASVQSPANDARSAESHGTNAPAQRKR
jgi:hypothetical protein